MAKQDETILILLDYLMTYTDEEHMSRADDINNYALETYGVSIDHRCVKTNLARLKDLCDKYPDKFPFILESNGGERPKYYIEQKYFSLDEIISIASAIKDTFQIDEATSRELMEKFVDTTTNHFQRDNVMNILSSQPEKSAKIKQTTIKVVKTIEEAIKEKRQITYCLKYSNNQERFTNFFYKIVYIGNQPIAIIIKDGKLVSLYAKDIKIIRVEEPWYNYRGSTFQIKDEYDGYYASPDEEIEAKIVPDTDAALTKTCSFVFDNKPYVVDSLLESFQAYFHRPLKYMIGAGKCFGQITTKIQIFLEWATQYNVARYIEVTGDDAVLFQLEVYYKEIMNRNKLNKYKIEWKDTNGRNHS